MTNLYRIKLGSEAKSPGWGYIYNEYTITYCLPLFTWFWSQMKALKELSSLGKANGVNP
jgi:hypothetical protein